MHDLNSTLASTFPHFLFYFHSLFLTKNFAYPLDYYHYTDYSSSFSFPDLLSSTNFGESVVYNSEVTDSMSVSSVFM